MAAHIDLSWLAGLLTSTPTATPNPDYNKVDETPYTDPKTGQTSGVIGQPRYVPPTNWQRVVHPEQSQAIDSLNNQFTSAPIAAQQVNDVRNTIGGQNFDIVRQYAPPSLQGVSPVAGYQLTGGDYQPTHMSMEGRAALNNQANVPGTLSSADIASAQNEANYQQRLQANQNATALADRESYANRIDALKNVGLYSRGYPEQQVKNIMTQEGQITPEEQALQLKTLDFQKQMAQQRLSLAPQTLAQMQNESTAGLYQSEQIPVGPPIINKVNPDGTIAQLARNPGGMSPALMTMQGVQQGMAGMNSGMAGMKTIGTTSTGLKGVVPNSNIVDPMEGYRPPIGTPRFETPYTDYIKQFSPVATSEGISHVPTTDKPQDLRHLDTVESQLRNMGILKDEELYTGHARQARKITPEQEMNLIASKMPDIQKLISKQRNSNSSVYRDILNFGNSAVKK